MDMTLKIEENMIYEDDELLVVKKPAGVAVQTARMGQQDMVSLLKNYRAEKGEMPYIGLVHRLDQPVEGVMVFAKTKAAAAELSKQVSEREVDKYYYAVVLGKLPEEKGELLDYLQKDGKSNTSKVVEKNAANAKKAELSYEVVDYMEGKCLIRIKLLTGRHHQIRVQMAHCGCPLYEDEKYGGTKNEGYLPLALCSYKISFFHPITGKKMEFEIEPEGKAFFGFF